MLRVIIDMREEELWGLLEGWRGEEGFEGWRVEKAALEVGDIAILDQEGKELVLLERKTAEDLGASQRDGRYREQRARLLAKRGEGVQIGYVLEAPAWSPTLSRSWCMGAFKEPHLQMAIVRLQMRYGIPVFQAASPKETVQWIRRIAAALVTDPAVFRTGLAETASGAAAAYTEAIHVKKASNMNADRVLHTILRTIPGVGAAAADAIVGHVGSAGFPAVFALTESELAELPVGKRKLGAKLAVTIWKTFHTSSPSSQSPSS
jgi:ERCC4-type nuclease